MTLVQSKNAEREALAREFTAAAQGTIDWIRRVMLPDPEGRRGVWERVLVDAGTIQYWVRPDCNSEVARAFHTLGKQTEEPELDRIAGNLLAYACSRQYPSGPFPFFDVIPPEGRTVTYKESGAGIWPNDNGKFLGIMMELADAFPAVPLEAAAVKLGDYFVAKQTEAGWWRLDDTDYPGTCFVVWPLIGLARLWRRTGNTAYRDSALRALEYLKSLQLPGGRMRTTFEINQRENWRPVSSESAMSLLAFSVARQLLEEDLERELTACGDFVLSLAADTGAIRNCDATCLDASEQNDPDLADLVYTNGYGLFAFVEAYRATGREAYRDAAVALGRFLAAIPSRDESPLWDGAWRGSYDVVRKEWRGRANHQNPLDEGGMYSVYTGWCNAPIAAGLLLTLEIV